MGQNWAEIEPIPAQCCPIMCAHRPDSGLFLPHNVPASARFQSGAALLCATTTLQSTTLQSSSVPLGASLVPIPVKFGSIMYRQRPDSDPVLSRHAVSSARFRPSSVPLCASIGPIPAQQVFPLMCHIGPIPVQFCPIICHHHLHSDPVLPHHTPS